MDINDQHSPPTSFSGEDLASENHWNAVQTNEPVSTNGHDDAQVVTMPSVLSHPAAELVTLEEADGIDRARQLAQELAGSLHRLTGALDENAVERKSLVAERIEMENRIRALEVHHADKQRFVKSLVEGPGGSLSNEDLQEVETLMESLKQDPDRLTLLFGVVQHTAQLAMIVGDYMELRRLAEVV